jgi:hypothetical protein
MKFKKSLPKAILLSLSLSASGQTLAQLPSPSSQEYLNQYGLNSINVFPAWSSATGAGVVVASLDTGANGSHIDLIGQLAEGGNYTDVDNQGGHGSTIAGLIAASFNGVGMMGVAYNSRVLPIQVANSDRFANASSAANGFNQAAGRADVGIISFSVGTIFSEPLNSSILSAMGAGKTVFIRAGNGGQSNPDVPPSVYNQFAGRGLIIGGFDPNLQSTASGSNKAGDSANVFLLAPGVFITGPGNTSNTSYPVWSGASVATAQAAGAAALLLSQNPDLTSEQIVELMVNTATDLGAPGIDPINGHGLLNIGAAMQAQGDLESSSDSSGGALGVGLAAVAVGGGLAYFWTQNKKAKKDLETTLVFDSYDRPYIMNLNQALSVQNTAPTLFNVMNMFDRQTRSVGVDLSDSLSLTMHANTNNPTDYVFLKDSDPFLEVEDQVRDEDLAMKMSGKFNNGFSFNLQHNYAPGSGFDQVGDLSLSDNFIWSSSYGSQYMGFGNISDNMSVGYQANNKLAFQLGQHHCPGHYRQVQGV